MKQAGEATWCDPGSDKPILQVATLQCCHCGRHFTLPRKCCGFCHNCSGPVCGESCAECVPKEQQLENMEQGRDLLWKPTRSFVPRNFSL